ncbi:unnamed protein product [Caenorhabditis auriculariae]|uniref:Phosphatidylinositol transfer protein N-terminal domain-containing protein n=1 Tax=Caenorhabditis auriculariae TaxID=2777116 RepID=A0A8S1HXP0_9PELO|nr:unnamed protein product [Caenorhabditis auriculariae]
MLYKEYRIPLPLDVDDFKRGQLYAVSELCRKETGGGEGAEFVTQREFTSSSLIPGQTVTGTYYHKIYRLKSKAPWILQKMLPEEAFEIHEESWSAYPYCKTVLTNPKYMKENFRQVIESTHLPDNGSAENPLNGPKKREIITLDICDDTLIGKSAYKEDRDPKSFRSEKAEVGPLEDEWIEEHEPIMCAYKLVSIHFKWKGLTSLVEKTVLKQYTRIFGMFHREAYASIDTWYDMTFEEVQEYELETAKILRKQLAEPEKRGTKCDDK